MTAAGIPNSVSFANFRLFNRKNNPKELDLIAAAFDESLLRRLKALPPPSLSLSWFSSAVDLLSFAHSEARALISGLNLDSDDSLLVWYLDDSVKILDLCNSITSDIERLRLRRLTVNCAVHLLRNPSPEKILHARDLLSGREASRGNGSHVEALLGDVAAKLGKTPPGKISAVGRFVRRTVHAVSLLKVFVAVTLTSALRDSPEMIRFRAHAPTEFSWGELFNEMEKAAVAEFGRHLEKKPLLVEVAEVEAGAEEARSAMDIPALKEATEELERRLEPMVVGLDGLTEAVNVMFRTVMEIRNSIADKLLQPLLPSNSKAKTRANRVVPAVCSS